jgi:hypothetical protein
VSNLVADGYAGLLDDGDGGKAEARESGEKLGKQGSGVAFDGEGGEAVGDDDGEVGAEIE